MPKVRVVGVDVQPDVEIQVEIQTEHRTRALRPFLSRLATYPDGRVVGTCLHNGHLSLKSAIECARQDQVRALQKELDAMDTILEGLVTDV